MKPNARTMRPHAIMASTGGWHPAICDDYGVWYWPNVTQNDRWKAQEWAEDTIERAIEDGTQRIVNQWNVFCKEYSDA